MSEQVLWRLPLRILPAPLLAVRAARSAAGGART